MTEEQLRSPPPTVIALLALMVLEVPKIIPTSRLSGPELLDSYWQQIVTELVKR